MNQATRTTIRTRVTSTIVFALPVLALVCFTACGGGGGEKPPADPKPVVKTILPDQGISVQQVDFLYPGGDEIGSTWGRLVVDATMLRDRTELRDGYVSVVTAKGWAVVNVPVPTLGEPPHAIFFDLGLTQSGPIDGTQLEIKHSNLGLEDIREHLSERVSFPVEKWIWQAQGIGPLAELEKLTPPEIPPYTIELREIPAFALNTFSHTQAITNVQCAVNQCFPMATANSLQFLENSGALTIPNAHAEGIGVVGDASSNTLVGQLDFYANRAVTTRTSGSGVWFAPMIEGTFEFLQDRGLDSILTFRHQDRGYGEVIPAGSFTAFGSTSQDDGATVSWNWIDDRITSGCALLMVWEAHAVRVTGAGQTLGKPWIRYSHDANQWNDGSGLENVVTFLTDPDGDGLLNMDGSSREIRWVWAACP